MLPITPHSQKGDVMSGQKTDELSSKYLKLQQGISCAHIKMHHSDFSTAWETAREFLGADSIAIEKSEEFLKLSEEDRQKIARNQKGLGEYGYFHHAIKPETTAALSVLYTLTARELFDKGFGGDHLEDAVHLDARYTEKLQNVQFVRSILTTFPDGKITQEMISKVLEPYPMNA